MIRLRPNFPQPPNYERLQIELDAGLALAQGTARAGSDSGGHYCDVPDNTLLSAVQAIVNTHNPATLTSEQQVSQVQESAKTQVQAIPSWASWTEAQVLAWFDTNVANLLPAVNLAEANTIMQNMATAQRAMVRMLVALRNETWPDLQE